MRNRLIGSSVLVGGAAALSLLASGVVAQEAGSPSAAQGEAAPKADPAAVNARQNRTDDQAVAGFLNRKRERQARREAALSRRGNAADQQELRRLYRALNIPRPNPRAQISAANQSALAESFETDSIQLLQSLNFKPARIRRLSDAGLNPLQAAAAYTRGTATVTEYALLSDVVAVARVVEVRNERLGDGFRSTVLLEITDSILGRAPNRPIALRQRSGEDENGQTLRVTSELQAVEDAPPVGFGREVVRDDARFVRRLSGRSWHTEKVMPEKLWTLAPAISADSVATWNWMSGVWASPGSALMKQPPWLIPTAKGPLRLNNHCSPSLA